MRKLTFIRALLLALFLAAGFFSLTSPASAQIAVGISVHVAPPALPVYVQPPCPTEGYIWTPGYWAYRDSDYYWVPGVWVAPPRVGLLWTPAYWGFAGGVYGFHAGYWDHTLVSTAASIMDSATAESDSRAASGVGDISHITPQWST